MYVCMYVYIYTHIHTHTHNAKTQMCDAMLMSDEWSKRILTAADTSKKEQTHAPIRHVGKISVSYSKSGTRKSDSEQNYTGVLQGQSQWSKGEYSDSHHHVSRAAQNGAKKLPNSASNVQNDVKNVGVVTDSLHTNTSTFIPSHHASTATAPATATATAPATHHLAGATRASSSSARNVSFGTDSLRPNTATATATYGANTSNGSSDVPNVTSVYAHTDTAKTPGKLSTIPAQGAGQTRIQDLYAQNLRCFDNAYAATRPYGQERKTSGDRDAVLYQVSSDKRDADAEILARKESQFCGLVDLFVLTKSRALDVALHAEMNRGKLAQVCMYVFVYVCMCACWCVYTEEK
jgi:hypothetical protein